MNETDVYRALPPPTALRGVLACLWVRQGGGEPVRVLPDACVDIVWRAGAGTTVAGPDTAFWLSPVAPGSVLVGARFLAGAGGAALGLPLSEIRDQRVGVASIGLGACARLAPDLDPSAALAELVRAAFMMAAAGPPDRAVQEAVRRLARPGQRVDGLAGELGFSERQLRRRFQAAVGYGPKTLARVLRLGRFLAGDAATWADEETLARAAADAGYADQAHLTRECRALTGLTPAQLRGA